MKTGPATSRPCPIQDRRRRCFSAWSIGVLAAGLVLALTPVSAFGHSSFLRSSPLPGTRLGASPREVTLTFTEALNARLTKAALVRLGSGPDAPSDSSVSGHRLTVGPTRELARGAYRVDWHSVSTDDGHALEGSFSFGVRASAVGAEHSVDQGPLARDGWVRVLARAVMYATLMLFAGGVLLRALLAGRRRSWLVPAPLGGNGEVDASRVAERERRLMGDIGLVAAGAATLSAIADAVDAAGGVSLTGLDDYLLGSRAGQARVAVVVFLLLAGLLHRRRPRLAVLPATLALGALALSGHASSARPRGLSIAVDWLHLLAAATWLGGIALVVTVWGPTLRRGSPAGRLSVAREVLPVFGRVALPAFVLVVASGGASALIELGSVAALWQTDYGRVLVVKMALVGVVAAFSFGHALRLRPRMLRAEGRVSARVERRHWRLLRSEPLVGVGIIAAVALLVAFPLPPRQLRGDEEARAAAPACNPCPLRSPRAGELAVAEQAGSDVVAAWVRRSGAGLAGEVRTYDLHGKPAPEPFDVLRARQSSCGLGCRQFATRRAPRRFAVRVRQRGRVYVARLPTRWRVSDGGLARRWLIRAQRRMRALRSVRENERVSSVPGYIARTDYRLKAPDRFAYRTNGGVRSIVIGRAQWVRPEPRLAWGRQQQYGGGLAFRTATWFNWTTYALNVFLLDRHREGHKRVATIATMDPGTPAWWRLSIDLDTFRVLRSRLVTSGHFMTQRFFAFNRRSSVQPPPGVSGGP